MEDLGVTLDAPADQHFADQVLDEYGWTVLCESASHARGQLRYFLVVQTPVGVLEGRVIRDVESKRSGDTEADCSRFLGDHRRDRAWQWFAALLYREIASRNLSPHKEPDDAGMGLLRRDALLVILRGVIILTAAARSED